MTHIYPKLRSPCRAGGFSPLSYTPALKALLPYYDKDEYDGSAPRRKFMSAPKDKGAFIKPLKQSFISNPRLSPGTRIMLALLSGWHGSGQGGMDTTVGVIAKALSRSRRQVHNYLNDAISEGYLSYTRRKDRMGYYIGIRIRLNFAAIRKSFEQKIRPQSQETRDVKYNAEINNNSNIYSSFKEQKDDKIMDALARFAVKAGYLDPIPPEIEPSS